MRPKKIENEKVDSLLREYEDQRVALKLMIDELEKIKVKIDTILPERLDNRFKYIFEEKIKTISALFQIVLDVRKEILKSIRDEVEVRTKVNLGEDVEESLEDIRGLAKRVEKLQKDAKELEAEQTKKEADCKKEERTEVLS